MDEASVSVRLTKLETDVEHIRGTVDRVPPALENLARVSQQIADGMASSRDLLGRVDDLDNRILELERNSASCQTAIRTWNGVALTLASVLAGTLLAALGWLVDRHVR